MNKIFKIVFNAARGKMMVVNEATSSVQTGKKAAVTVAVVAALASSSAMATTLLDKNGGEAWYTTGSISTTIENKTFENLAVTGIGGAFGIGTKAPADTVITVKNSTFNNNHAVTDGGAIGSYGGVLKISNSTFENNTAQLDLVEGDEWKGPVNDSEDIGGGAIALGAVSNADIASVENTTFKNNHSGKDGGAIATRKAAHADNSEAKLTIDAKFEGNTAAAKGGAIYNSFYAGDNGVEVTGKFTGNKAASGGAIFNDGSVDKAGNKGGVMTVANAVFTGNSAVENGGAVYNSGELTFKGTNTFTGNTAAGKANDIYNVGAINLAEGSVLSLAGGLNGEGTVEGTGSIVITDAAATITGQTVADTITASATGEVNDALGGDITKLESNLGGVTVTGMEEGAVMGAVGPDGEMQVNTKTEALADKVALAPEMITRIMMNDVRKRMGDLRAAEGTHGVWARYNGGQMSGAGVDADFHMVQVGIDTVPVVDAPRFGVAFSYAQAEAKDNFGTTDMDSFSLAFYGTKMYDSGMFVDVIGRMATMDNDIVNAGAKGKMDNVALSLSGELGWRFDVTDRFFFEPSVEATYTYTNADTFTMTNGGTYELEAVDSLVGRAGFAAGFKCPANKGDVYVRAAVVHEFMGDMTVNSSINNRAAASLEADGKDTWFEYAIGANFNVNKNTYVYADLERTAGAAMDEDWRANVGVRFAF